MTTASEKSKLKCFTHVLLTFLYKTFKERNTSENKIIPI